MTWLAAAVLVLASAADEPYAWPLDLPRELSSSFGEYRTGRFHAGIDLRTNGVGREVYAAADGYVSRLTCSPWGYGKALYLRFEDGNTAVYAHLDAFAEPFQSFVRAAQHAAESYSVDLAPSAGQFPVKRGQLVAFSGDSGVGVAHLHYELRDPQNRPVNPRLLGVTWPDSAPPVIGAVLVAPGAAGACVNGDLLPLVLKPKAAGARTYRCEPVRASGRIGFGISVIDPANGGNKLGIRTLSASAGGAEFFRVCHDSLSYETLGDGAVAYHPFLLDRGRFLLAWRWPGNRSMPYAGFPGDGVLEVPGAPVEVRLAAEDFAGNAVEVIVPLLPAPFAEAPAPPAPAPRDATGRVLVEPWGDWLSVTATFPADEPETPVLSAPGFSPAPRFCRIDGRVLRAVVPLPARNARFTLTVSHPRLPAFLREYHCVRTGSGAASFAASGLRFSVPGEAAYGALVYDVAECPAPPAPFPVLGAAYAVGFTGMPARSAASITFPMPEGAVDPARVRVYRHTGNDWTPEPTEHTRDGLVVRTRRTGVFAAMEDSAAPSIRGLSPASGAVSRRPAIDAGVSDIGAGIDSIRVTCGSAWLLMRYDPEDNRIEWERDRDLPDGAQELRFEVTDAAGNLTVETRNLVVSE